MEFLFGPGMLFRNAVLGGALVAVLCSLLGVYLVLRRLVLLGVALPQSGAAGIAATFWLTGHAHQADGGHWSALVGSLVATFATLGGLLSPRRIATSPTEWRVGALFAIASAATVLFVALDPSGDLEMTNLLRGELLSLGDFDLIMLAGATLLSLVLFFAFRREILLASFDPEFARTIGREPSRADALLFALLGIAIALGVMNAGPLVVFGFLVLPPLAALRLAPGLTTALALSAVIALACSVGGFALAYQVDLPTGPTSVALAAVCWLAAGIAARLRRRPVGRAAATLAVLLAATLSLFGPSGCRTASSASAPHSELSRGSLPDLSARGPVAVARFRNETPDALVIASGNPLAEIRRAAGASGSDAWTVPDALQAQAVLELAARGIEVRGFDADRAALPDVPAGPEDAARAAQRAGIHGPVLFGRLQRFTQTRTGLLLVHLELVLIDAANGEVLWTGAARKPVAVRSALTAQEVLVDAAPAMFAQAFGPE